MTDANRSDKAAKEKRPDTKGRGPIVRSETFETFSWKMEVLKAKAVLAMEIKSAEMMDETVRMLELDRAPQDDLYKEIKKIDRLLYNKIKYQNMTKRSQDGDLPAKKFLARESVLTYLFEIRHFRTIYNIFFALLCIVFVNTALYDLVVTGELNLGMTLIQWNFAGLDHVVVVWLGMMAAYFCVYPCSNCWCNQRIKFPPKAVSLKAWDWGWLCALIAYQVLLGIVPVVILLKFNFPPALSFMLLIEQVRLMMKSRAFVRSNISRALRSKPHSDVDSAL